MSLFLDKVMVTKVCIAILNTGLISADLLGADRIPGDRGRDREVQNWVTLPRAIQLTVESTPMTFPTLGPMFSPSLGFCDDAFLSPNFKWRNRLGFSWSLYLCSHHQRQSLWPFVAAGSFSPSVHFCSS